MHFEDVFNNVAVGFEAIERADHGGQVRHVAGARSPRATARGEGGQIAYSTLRNTLGAAILVGLEVLVAADLIRTITSKPSIEDAVILGIIVLIRTVLSMSIQIEIRRGSVETRTADQWRVGHQDENWHVTRPRRPASTHTPTRVARPRYCAAWTFIPIRAIEDM